MLILPANVQVIVIEQWNLVIVPTGTSPIEEGEPRGEVKKQANFQKRKMELSKFISQWMYL